jgi:hypothetical protein
MDNKTKIELVTNESGDQKVLSVDCGETLEYSGRSIPDHIWIALLEKFGCKVECKIISDEDMEEGNY